MALAAATVWEVRTTGSDTNGGGFVAGATGTDWSQQDTAQYSVTDGVTAGTTTITSATAAFGTDVVGNIMYVQGGTGSVSAGWYQIVSRTNATTVVVDRSTGLTAGTGVTLIIGGALASVTNLASLMVNSNKAFVKAGTYTQTASATFSAGGAPNSSNPYSKVIGYATTRTDAGQATIALSTNSSLTGINLSGTGWQIENIIVDCGNLATSIGFKVTQYSYLYNCKVLNFKSYGINATGANSGIINCEVTAGASGALSGINVVSGVFLFSCYVHDNVCTGITVSQNAMVLNCIVSNNTGASSDGISAAYQTAIVGNSIYQNGRDGIRGNSTYAIVLLWLRNILVNNGGYGIREHTSAGFSASSIFDGNAFYNNTSGSRFGMDDTTVNPQNGVSPYTNVRDVSLTGVPFTNAASNDYSLNNTAGQGAACRAAGYPGVFPAGLTTGYPDMGAAQHQDAGGGGSVAFSTIGRMIG